MTKDKMVGWHHWHNGHEFEQTQGDSEGQGSLTCCSLWGYKESDDLVTEQLQSLLKVLIISHLLGWLFKKTNIAKMYTLGGGNVKW